MIVLRYFADGQMFNPHNLSRLKGHPQLMKYWLNYNYSLRDVVFFKEEMGINCIVIEKEWK